MDRHRHRLGHFVVRGNHFCINLSAKESFFSVRVYCTKKERFHQLVKQVRFGSLMVWDSNQFLQSDIKKGSLKHLQCWSRSDETTAAENLIMFLSYVVMEWNFSSRVSVRTPDQKTKRTTLRKSRMSVFTHSVVILKMAYAGEEGNKMSEIC